MSSFTTTALKMAKFIVMSLMVTLVLWVVYKNTVRYLTKGVVAAEIGFLQSDNLRAAPFAAGTLTEITSDRTLDAILAGNYGPAVIMVYADWCIHCKNMTEAFENASKTARVPFIKVQGSLAPVTCKTHAVAGYPTVFGVGDQRGPPRRFGGHRTTEALLDFSKSLESSFASSLPSIEVIPSTIVVPEAPPEAPPVVEAAPAS